MPGSQTPHGELGPADSRLRLTRTLSSPQGIFHHHHPSPQPREEPFSRGWEPRRLHGAGTGALLLCKYWSWAVPPADQEGLEALIGSRSRNTAEAGGDV